MMQKYKIVETADAQTLEKQVNNLIEKGYRPLGGMRIVTTPYQSFICYQTLILEDCYGEEKLEFQEKTSPVLRN